jgi:toxin YoeB
LIVGFLPDGWADYQFWQENDRIVLRKLNGLIKECSRMPFEGLGHPEPLSGDLSGFWSRRIDREQRLVYRVVEERLEIAQCRYHYERS